jgi:hypothetical protein
LRNYDTKVLLHNIPAEENFWLTIASCIIAAAVVLFEVIPMSSIVTENVIIKHQQDEHIIYLNTKPEDEHVIAIASFGSFLLSPPKSTSFKNDEAAAKAKKLLHRTFRIPEDVIKALDRESNSRGVPLSNIVNKILKDYVSVELHSEKTGLILTSKDFFRRVFNKIDEKSIEEYGKELGYAIVSEYTSSFFPEINSNTLVQFLDSWFKRFDSYQHRIDEENSRHSFSVNHDINKNFSIVLKIILEGLVEPITKSRLIFGEITSSCITFTFEI